MKIFWKFLLVFLVLILAFTPTQVSAQDPTPQPENQITGDQLVVGNSFSLGENYVLDGSILIIGGIGTTAVDSSVNGDIMLVGGTLSIDGTVNGDIVSIGGSMNLGDGAVVNGDLGMLGGSLQRSNLAVINGGINQNLPSDFDLNFSEDGKRWFPFTSDRSPLGKLLGALLQSLVMGVLAILVGLLFPHNIKNIASTITKETLVSGGIGLLTIIVAPIVFLLIMITIILIPVSALGFIALGLAFLLGFIAVGYEIGQRLAGLFKTTWHPSMAAGLGTLLLSLVTGLANIIPCIGWVLGFVAGIIGLGAVITSRVGSEKYANRLINAVIPSTASIPSPITGQGPDDTSATPPSEPPQL